MESWAKNDFEDDWDGTPPVWSRFEEIDLQDRPHALVQGALQPCVGGPFYPGIEITFISQFKDLYAEPFVIDPNIGAGQLTQYMALPWQSDFFQCHTHWWPAQRPDDVVSEAAYKAVHPECDVPISEWKGQDIVNFQEELMEKASGRISEKWFYTHIRGEQEKLPREDMTNVIKI